MSAPLVVNTKDGMCWTRRSVTSSGLALYAPEGVCSCPEFVMATLVELAEHGIVGSADVLPMPTAAEPQAEVLPLRVVAELNNLRMRLAGVANPPREVFLALYDGAEPELFTTVEAARECCDDLAKTDAHGNYWDWTVNENGIHVQFWTHPDDDRPLSETSGFVTPIVVQGDEPLSELEQLRERVAELEQLLVDAPIAVTLTEQASVAADKLTRLLAPTQALHVEEDCDHPNGYGPNGCAGCGEFRPPADDEDGVSPQVARLRNLLAGQRTAVEGEHYTSVHHTYRVPRDLPETGGA